MTLKVKLLSLIAMICLVAGIMIVGIFSAQTQQIKLNGQVNFEIGDKSLYVKDVRLQENMDTSTIYSLQDSGRFMPGYVNGEFNMNLGDFTNTYGSFALYFDIINTIDETSGETFEYTASSSTTQSGVTVTTTILDSNDSSITQIPQGTIKPSEITPSSPISATIKLTISGTEGANIDLSGITITISEYVPPAVQVTSVSSSGATTDTYNDLAGGVAIDGSVDLSGITFNTGETTLTISMTSLSANYIKNIVSYDSSAVDYNTTGTSGTLFVHSTSLYLPQNTSEQLTSGESKDLTIYVNNNTGSPTTISGLQVSFESYESLLHADTENQYWYVEMGTVMGQTQSEYIRWKYIASVNDSTGSDVATKYSTFDANTAPTGEGYFYLETNVLSAIGRDGTNNMIEVSFNNDYTNSYHNLHGWTDVEANDYATSNVRQYINGNDSYDSYSGNSSSGYTPSGRLSNMYDDLNIDTANDIIYNQIITRSLGELYKDNTNSTTNPIDVPFPDLSGADVGYRYQKTDEDAFWLLSYYEVYQLTGNSTSTNSDSGRVWPTGSANYYWLRSPDSSFSHYAFVVYTSGSLISNYVGTDSRAARAAFKFSI